MINFKSDVMFYIFFFFQILIIISGQGVIIMFNHLAFFQFACTFGMCY